MFAEESYTPWVSRLLAYLVDFAPILVLVAASFATDAIASSDDLSVVVGVIAPAVIVVYFWWNFCYRQGKTGQSIGKSVLQFKVVSERTGQPIGSWWSFVRQLAHYVDQAICFLGYLWPLWDDKRQTFADKIVGTVCIPVNAQVPQPITVAWPPVPHPAGGPYSPAKRNVPAIMSFVFGLIGFVAAPVSVICGVVGLKRASRGHGGRGLSIAGMALSGAWVLALAGTIAYLKLTGAFTIYSAPRTGDCIAEIPRYSDVLIVPRVDCATPHVGEVVAVLTLPDGDYPAMDTLGEYRTKCASALAAYAPVTVGDPSVGLYVRYPSEMLWRQNGYRDVTCAATFTTARTGSIKG